METCEIEKLEQKKQRIKEYLRNPYNLVFLAVVSFAIIIRFYYFFLTKNQPLWWDEADYMAYAKNLAGIDNQWILTPQHSSFFPYIAAALMKIGFSEAMLRFFLEVLPSILLVFITYYLVLNLYDRKIALLCTFLMAIFWENLFNSFRFHLETMALLFSFLTFYVFFKGYEKKEKIFKKIDSKFAIPIAIVFFMLVYSIRRSFIMFAPVFLIYLLLTKNFKELIKDKYNWISLFIGIILFFLIENLIFIAPIKEVAGTYYVKDASLNLIPLDIFPIYFSSLENSYFSFLLYLFYFGFFILLINIVLSLDCLKKIENSKIKSDLFNLLLIIITLLYFILIQRRVDSVGDPRWYYPLLLGSFVCISKATITISEFIKKYNKYLAILSIIVLIGYGGYYELQHADMIIKNKIPTYNGIKQAGLFINSISSKEDIVFSVPDSQPSYYAEREVIIPQKLTGAKTNTHSTFDEFLENINKPENKNVKYFIVTFSEPGHPPWMRTDYQDRIEIPFMESIIYFSGQNHKIIQSKTYGDIEFRLLNIFEDAFVYEIIRS